MDPDDLEPLADPADLAEQDEAWIDDDEPDDGVVPDPDRVVPVDEER